MKERKGHIRLDRDEALERCEIVPPVPFLTGVWIDGDLCDDIERREALSGSYGSHFYASVTAFRTDRALTIDDVWPATGSVREGR